MTAYYNEHDPFAAGWLRELIKAGLIAPGEVDERSIEDVTPAELSGFTQCHFFAGVGVWSYALRCAGWPDDRPVWTGSCPCQPFSAAGKGAGFADERHLWPAFHHLIESCRPVAVFGEQVASADGLGWLDLVQSDLEGAGYTFGAVDTCAAGFGAPHIRQRLYWVADAQSKFEHRECGEHEGAGHKERVERGGGGAARWLADAECDKEHEEQQGPAEDERERSSDGTCGCRMADSSSTARPTDGHWRDADWLLCRDGKWRPVEPGTFPLAHGAANRVGRLRGYGNALVAPQAEGFVRAFMEVSANYTEDFASARETRAMPLLAGGHG